MTDITQAQLERNKRLDYAGPKHWANWPAVGDAALIMMATTGVIYADVLMPVDTIEGRAVSRLLSAARC